MKTQYFTRWAADSVEHAEQQCRNGSVVIKRPGFSDWAEFMNGDFMGRIPNPVDGAYEISKHQFKAWSPNFMK